MNTSFTLSERYPSCSKRHPLDADQRRLRWKEKGCHSNEPAVSTALRLPLILKEEGLDVVGFFDAALGINAGTPLKEMEFKPGRCCSIEDLYDAREVAARLGFPFYVVDFQKEFENIVVRDFVESYRRTVSPLPLCCVQFTIGNLIPCSYGRRAGERSRWGKQEALRRISYHAGIAGDSC